VSRITGIGLKMNLSIMVATLINLGVATGVAAMSACKVFLLL
jgi:hypothetical protein